MQDWYLKFKELDEKACEIDEKIEIHGLDEDGEYDDKVKYILENENDLEIFENLEPEEVMSELKDYHCNLCENVFETEIRLVVHEWQDHREKSTLIVVPRNPPP